MMNDTRLLIDWRNREIRIGEVTPDPGKIIWSIQFSPYEGVFGVREMAFMLADNQQVTATIQAVDAKGNPARIDGAPVWASSDAAILTVTSDGEMGATIAAVGPIGTAQVQVTVDADLGAGVRPLTGIMDVEVVGSEAVALTIVPGEPVTQG